MLLYNNEIEHNLKTLFLYHQINNRVLDNENQIKALKREHYPFLHENV